MTKYTDEFDKLFCLWSRTYKLPKLFLKAVAICESSLNATAYRYEPEFWNRYLKNNPEWKDRDPAEVSASWGLMQQMYVVAWELGFRGSGEELLDPQTNIALGAKLFDRILGKAISSGTIREFFWLRPSDIILAQYNGGASNNPQKNGEFRNPKYVKRVNAVWDELKKIERECDNE